MGTSDPDAVRAEAIERWERSAPGWGKRAQVMRDFGMPVSIWMIEHAGLQPGQRVLDLAAGPGDTGFLAAEVIRPGGTLVCSDASDGMLEVARARARELGIENVEFKRLELEWIDLPTASVDAVLCRWGFMLSVDPEAALREARRVLRPGGRIALAVWDRPDLNPWATVPTSALVELDHATRPDPDEPGMFALAAPERVREMLESAGFVDAVVESVDLLRTAATIEAYLAETLDCSQPFAAAIERLSEDQRVEVGRKMFSLAEPYIQEDGSLRMPGRSLVAAADA
jgi:SAM-dependent methyltransferase